MTLVATLAEAKAWINYTGGAADDTKMTTVLTAASEWVEYAIGGPLSPTVLTELRQLNSCVIQPNKVPLVSVTSITPDQGTALDTTSYFADTTSGLIVSRGSWFYGYYTVVYTAGLAAILSRQKTAGLEVFRHLWMVQNGSAGRGYPGEELVQTPLGFAVPRRAQELLAPDRRVYIA
jgi:hypothetical protein